MNSNEGFARRSVLVTGASTGIGQATALLLDRNGFNVFAGVRKESDALHLEKQSSDRLAPVYLDVTSTDDIQAALALVSAKLAGAKFCGLVNNAGIVVAGPLEFLSLEAFRNQLEVNLFGQLAVTQAFLPLIRQYSGRIVLMSSINGVFSPPLLGPYSAAKFGLEALADALRVELRPWSIPVSVIQPGNVATPIWQKTLGVADQLMAALPPAARTLYEPIFATRLAQAAQRGRSGFPPERVAAAILHALTAKRPRTRYRIGTDAWGLAIFARLLPDGWRDALIARWLKLPRLA